MERFKRYIQQKCDEAYNKFFDALYEGDSYSLCEFELGSYYIVEVEMDRGIEVRILNEFGHKQGFPNIKALIYESLGDFGKLLDDVENAQMYKDDIIETEQSICLSNGWSW